ncbi:hypothetical protein AFERRID_12250 [Acidithiobacillus ferridurans]|uniref:Uncharacterized protein n=1 Tax=Acidithiobacillus ferridurans TaxID=1232575 RepID=A0A2Z6IJZ5_ACIFI|nr:hypothetical protein AFERRID_12250 [Acidithiobacillus ferridurans]
MESHDIQTISEILTKLSGRNHFLQVTVGGGNEAQVQGDFPRRTQGANGPLLNGPQQLDLHHHRQITDLIQKNSAPIGRRKESFATLYGTGISPLFGTEELTLHQPLGNGAAVDGHEGLVVTGSRGMNGACGQFLARTGLTGDVYRRITPRYAADIVAQALHDRRIADQSLGAAQTRWGQAAEINGLGYQSPQTRQLDGLGHVIEGPRLHRFDGTFGGRIGRNHGDRHLWI